MFLKPVVYIVNSTTKGVSWHPLAIIVRALYWTPNDGTENPIMWGSEVETTTKPNKGLFKLSFWVLNL